MRYALWNSRLGLLFTLLSVWLTADGDSALREQHVQREEEPVGIRVQVRQVSSSALSRLRISWWGPRPRLRLSSQSSPPSRLPPRTGPLWQRPGHLHPHPEHPARSALLREPHSRFQSTFKDPGTKTSHPAPTQGKNSWVIFRPL